MKKLTRITAALMCGVLLVNPQPAFATQTADVVTTSLASDFEYVTATVDLAAGNDITSGIVSLDYDKDVLEVVDVKTNDEMADLVETGDDLSFSWVSMEAVNDAENIMTVDFKVKDASSKQVVSVTTNVKEIYSEDDVIVADTSYESTCVISLLDVEPIKDQTYTGKEIKPTVTVMHADTKLKLNKDYKVSYSDNTDAGVASATITGKGAYSGYKAVVEFNILPKKIASSRVSTSADVITLGSDNELRIRNFISVDGKKIDDNYKLTVVDANGKTVSGNVIKKAGKYTLTIEAGGNYTGTIVKNVTVTKKEVKIFGRTIAVSWTVK